MLPQVGSLYEGINVVRLDVHGLALSVEPARSCSCSVLLQLHDRGRIVLSMKSPKSSPAVQFFAFGSCFSLRRRTFYASSPPLGSPLTVRRGTNKSLPVAVVVTVMCSFSLPVALVSVELSGWWLLLVCDLFGSIPPSIRFDHI